MQAHVSELENELSSMPFKRGKVKDIYELDSERLLFVFTERVSAYDIVLSSTIPRKGEVLCKLAAYWFNYLKVPHHMVRVENPNRMVVRKLKMIPVECVVRGYLYGSLFERLVKGDVNLPVKPINAVKLPEPYFDPTTKSDLKDEPVTVDQVVDEGWLDTQEINTLKDSSVNIYKKMFERADKAGFILADLKLEFGFDEESNIVLADSIGPDEFRLWPKENYSPGKNQESYDKQLIRDWLSKAGYKQILDEARKAGQPTPRPPRSEEHTSELQSLRHLVC